MSSDYIPTELLFDILTRLPVKTLLRFTSVSKSWHSLITSPSFITTHLNNQRNLNNKTPFLLLGHCTKEGKYLWKDHFSLRFDNETFDEFADLDFPDIISEEANQDFWIVGTCDGLVCLSSSAIIALWNPSLRKSLILPKPLLQLHGLIPRDIRLCIGFGIHPVTNDYKIVRLTYLGSDRVLVPPEVELFELSTGSWRIINAGNFSYVAPIDARQAFLNGVVHWAGYKPKYISNKSGSSFRTVIMSFDMRNDALGFVKAPACVKQHWHWSMRVTIFGESLSFSYFGVDKYCCVWVMNEYGIEGSWTKQFNIDLGGNLGRPIFFKENGDILLERCGKTYCGVQLVSYDPKSKLIKNLNVHGIPCSLYVDTYNESLVLARGLNEVLGRLENFGDAVTCRATYVLPREEDEVKGKSTIMKNKNMPRYMTRKRAE